MKYKVLFSITMLMGSFSEIVECEYWDEDLDRVSYFLHKNNTPSDRQTTAKQLCDDGKSFKEIAAIMGCSYNNARQLIWQAEYKAEKLAALEEYYKKHPDRKPVAQVQTLG